MRSKKQLRFITVLMSLCLALIGLFLGIWINSSYQTEQRNLNKALNVLYNELTQEQFMEYITGELSRYVLQQQLSSGMLSLDQISALQRSQIATAPNLLSAHITPIDSRHRHISEQRDSGTESPSGVLYYNSIDEAPDSIKQLLVSQIKSISSTQEGLTIIADNDSAASVLQKSGVSMPQASKNRNTTGRAPDKATNLNNIMQEVMGMINGVNMIKSVDTTKLLDRFSQQVSLRYEGLKTAKTRHFNDDFVMDNERSVASLLGMEVYVYNYKAYLWSGLYMQLILSLVLFLICTLTFYFSYRTMVQQQLLTIQKNDFISNTAHELKTPITTSLLALEAFNHFDIKDHIGQTKEYIGIAQSELKRLEYFVLNILNQLSLDQGTIQFQKVVFPLELLLQHVLARYEATIAIQRKQLEISGLIPTGVLFGDQAHLERAIGNVLDNAIKYGHYHIVVAARVQDDSLIITIEDDGEGIAPKETKKVFEKFYRVHSEKGHIVKGHGLGLAYTQYVLKVHNGSVSIDRSAMGGAKFMISIPMK